MAAGVQSAAMKTPALILILLVSALPAPASAWSRQGHQLVGELAEHDLSPAARREVKLLLAGETDPSLAGIATWADEIRAESREGGHALGERSSRWHYVNFPRGLGCHYVPARDCPDGNCAIGAINTQRAILADRSRPLAERRDALKFLVHFVGDVHQPLHAGYGDDRGGNDFQLQYRGKGAPKGGQGTQLHGVWDYWMLQSAGLDNAAYTQRLLQSPVPADSMAGADNPPAEWALESCRLIESEALYPTGRRVIGDAYVDLHRPLAERRIRQAGARLAALLNATLAPPR